MFKIIRVPTRRDDIPRYNIKLVRGDTFRTEVGASQDGEPYEPQNGDVIRFSAKKYYQDKKVAISKVVPNETLLLELQPSDTKSLDFGPYYYEVQITFANGDVDTFICGELELLPEAD